MIIRDDHGTVVIDSRVTNVIVDQNGNEWKLTDDGGLVIELLHSTTYFGLAIVPLAFRTVRIQPDELPRQKANGVDHS